MKKSSDDGHVTPKIDERRAKGAEWRRQVPLSAQAEWKAPANRADPVEILITQGKNRIAELLPVRYARMKRDPFAFLRGAAAIMAADLASTPSTGLRVQICGDCHLMNFGGFATPERTLVFDINDFDETLPASFEWDLKRLAASFVIAARWRGFKDDQAREIAVQTAASYRESMRKRENTGILEAWYSR